MRVTGVAKAWWHLGLIAACVLLAAFLSACGGDADTATNEKVLALEAKLHSLEESLEALQGENQTLLRELIDLRQRQTNYFQEQEAAKIADRIEREAATDLETGQEEQLATLEEGLALTGQRLDDLESRLRELEAVASQVERVLPAIEKWFTGTDNRLTKLEGTVVERTVMLAEEAGGEVYYIDTPTGKRTQYWSCPWNPSKATRSSSLSTASGETPLTTLFTCPFTSELSLTGRPAVAQRYKELRGPTLLEPHRRVRKGPSGRRCLSVPRSH